MNKCYNAHVKQFNWSTVNMADHCIGKKRRITKTIKVEQESGEILENVDTNKNEHDINNIHVTTSTNVVYTTPQNSRSDHRAAILPRKTYERNSSDNVPYMNIDVANRVASDLDLREMKTEYGVHGLHVESMVMEHARQHADVIENTLLALTKVISAHRDSFNTYMEQTDFFITALQKKDACIYSIGWRSSHTTLGMRKTLASLYKKVVMLLEGRSKLRFQSSWHKIARYTIECCNRRVTDDTLADDFIPLYKSRIG